MSSAARVYLVGAGPGDPGLITVAGADLLRRADAVVYDYLANAELLKLCRPDAEKIYVGKSAGQHTKSQDEINAMLVDKARELSARDETNKERPSVIVRLKGGDPYVFGRGGEEAEYLQAHGISFEVIPGITAGIAAPAYAGIPVTHRDFASTISLITGHERDNEDDDARINYEALAKLGGTLVFYMGIKNLPVITEKLMTAGLDAATPAAVVRWGTHAKQQSVVGTLTTIAELVQRAGITAPAITIVGHVVSLRDKEKGALNWFESRPLFGQKILVTRTRQQASELTQQLSALGAQVMEVATIEVAPPESWEEIDQRLTQIPAYDWVVFTSANGVRAAWDRLRKLGFDARHFGASNIAAIGPATAKVLEEIGIIADLLPEKFVGEELPKALKEHLGGEEIGRQRFLLLRADIARPALREELEKLGARVEDVAIYETRRPDSLPQEVLAAIESGKMDWVTFTSASTANNLWELLSPGLRKNIAQAKRVSIGPITTAALTELKEGAVNWAPTVEAGAHHIQGMVDAMMAWPK